MRKAVCALGIVLGLAFSGVYAQVAGSFPVIFNNLARATYPDSQIYIYSIGMTGGQWCYMTKDGTMNPMNAADATAPGHLVKNGKNYPNYNFRLSEAQNFRIPPSVGGGRLYMAVGSPMYMTGNAGGVQLPDPNNPGDPNDSVYYDWFEYTYIYNQLQFGGNTTQVDLFGFPYVAIVRQDAGGGVTNSFLDSCGVNIPRDQIIKQFGDSMSAPFQGCIRPCRVVAPRSSSQFGTGGAYVNYLKPYLDSLWTLWKTAPLNFNNGNNHYIGTVNAAGTMVFTGAEAGSMAEPTTQAVWACAGFPGYVGAAFSAALNRGVAGNGADYYNPASYYKRSPYMNEFSKVLHDISIHHLAYGFGYDDNNNQSSVLIVGSSKPLTSLTITIEPFVTPTNTTAPIHSSAAHKPAIRYLSNNQIALGNAGQIKSVSLVSLDGKNVLGKIPVNNNIISTAGLARGTYYVKIMDRQGIASTSKIVKR
jgi:Beta-1,3-glucanase